MSTITLTISTEDGATFRTPPIRRALAMPLLCIVAPCHGRHADTLSAPLSVVGPSCGTGWRRLDITPISGAAATPCETCGATDTRNMCCVDGPRWGLPHTIAVADVEALLGGAA